MPAIILRNRQRAHRPDLGWLRRFARAALPLCLERCGGGRSRLGSLEEITVAIVSDRVIAQMHQQYMGIPGATDVITFEHGDIVVSADMARARAAELGHRPEEELALYIVHALLHLNGFDDTTPGAAARMRKVQDRIWRNCRAHLPLPPLEP